MLDRIDGERRHVCRTQGGVCKACVRDAGWGLSGMRIGRRVGSARHGCRTQGGVCQACA